MTSNKREQVVVENREVTGKKVKVLRDEGVLPANVYGPNTESVAVQMDRQKFEALMKRVGETELVDIQIKGDDEWRPVLIYDVQHGPVHGRPLHVDFYQVNLKEKVEVAVPIELIGDAPAVVNKIGVLLTLMDELPINVLPTEIPSHIEVDITSLADVGGQITIEELNIPDGVEIAVEDLTEPVVKINALRLEEEVEEEEDELEGEEGVEGEEVEGEDSEVEEPNED